MYLLAYTECANREGDHACSESKLPCLEDSVKTYDVRVIFGLRPGGIS